MMSFFLQVVRYNPKEVFKIANKAKYSAQTESGAAGTKRACTDIQIERILEKW